MNRLASGAQVCQARLRNRSCIRVHSRTLQHGRAGRAKRSYYDVLGVSPKAGAKEIKVAYGSLTACVGCGLKSFPMPYLSRHAQMTFRVQEKGTGMPS